ncbi:conserved hypothetical protein [Catenulispora acidiphila DSM 44928]|uniref:Uncharacterized protein n=1 Tax=Catenulispora acidiphila (strain DSM 44928 / JCM 14897 / NBRC 102108 / NRRL B-24433 / ID139908) TaxID=479433 RepID=C7QAU1_CATAD|nr:conserved hypothetical protein [Catenulispora acidiphila DSM 44928]
MPEPVSTSRVSAASGRLLVDWSTYPPVGHVIEGMQIAGAYAAANPGLSVSLALPYRSPLELAECCDFLDGVYPVAFDPIGTEFPTDPYAEVPRDFEWTFRCHRRDDPVERGKFPLLARLSDAAAAHFAVPGDAPGLPYRREQNLRLRLPAQARQEADRILSPHVGSGPVLAVLPSGGGERAGYPSTGSWLLMLRELRAAWPDATIVLLGKTAGAHGRRSSAMPQKDAAELMAAVDAVDGYDLPLLVQLALIQRASLLFSPHSGFSFAALTVGTPWLTLSGGAWFEYFHNGVPFHSLLPDTARFPAFGGVAHRTNDSDGSGVREASMTRERIEETIPELLEAASDLIAGRRDYEQCLAAYFPRLLSALGGDKTAMASWDRVHERFIEA